MNKLRRGFVQTDGGIRTGRDVAIAAILGRRIWYRNCLIDCLWLHYDAKVPPEHLSGGVATRILSFANV